MNNKLLAFKDLKKGDEIYFIKCRTGDIINTIVTNITKFTFIASIKVKEDYKRLLSNEFAFVNKKDYIGSSGDYLISTNKSVATILAKYCQHCFYNGQESIKQKFKEIINIQ